MKTVRIDVQGNTTLKLCRYVLVSVLLLVLGACNNNSSVNTVPSDDATVAERDPDTGLSGTTDEVGGANGSGDVDSTTVSNDSSVVTASTEELQNTAARLATSGMEANLDSLRRLSDEALDDVESGSLANDLVDSEQINSLSVLGDENRAFIESTLGLEGSNARVVRNGDVVSIDPDEVTLCAADYPFLGAAGYDGSNCEQVMSELTVDITARTISSGNISYQFQNSELMTIDYSNDSASYELRLPALQQLSLYADELSGVSRSSINVASGAIKLTTTMTNQQPGTEAGELLVEVTQTLDVRPSDDRNSRLLLEPSTVFQVISDAASNQVEANVNWGALQLFGDISDEEDGSMLAQLRLAGLTANMRLDADTSTLQVQNLGLKGTPLTININQVEEVTLSLSTFDVTLNAAENLITFDGALGAALTVSNVLNFIDGLGPEATANLSVSAEEGTSLRDLNNGTARVLNNGPVSISAGVVSNGVSLQQNATFNEGDCFSQDEIADAGLGLGLVSVPCNQ